LAAPLLFLVVASAYGQGKADFKEKLEALQNLEPKQWTIDGVARDALLYVPEAAKSSPSPVVFVFHGHGGTMRNSAIVFHMHRLWPEAIVVYPQGLNTPGRLTDPEGKKPGWQSTVGNQDDRDLKFFDAILASLKKDYRVDEKRIYSTGHSNGGGFTYLLWAARGDVFAALAPSSAFAGQNMPLVKPKPVLHVAGETDPLVKFEWQKATIDRLKQLNGCDEQGQEYDKLSTIYPSKDGNPVVTYIHPGDHTFAQDSLPVIVKFFKQHAQP
jgi:polyhydroxybutyrate depolymerase